MRFRPLMIPSVLEKFSYAIAVFALVSQGRVRKPAPVFGGADLLLGILFLVSYFKTPARAA